MRQNSWSTLTARPPCAILGEPDDWKLWQCLTLFAVAVPDEAMFAKGLERFFDGRQAGHTLKRLKELESGGQP